jgi:hypothetical protein
VIFIPFKVAEPRRQLRLLTLGQITDTKTRTDLALHFLASAKLASQSRPQFDEVAAIPFIVFKGFAAMGVAMAPTVIDRTAAWKSSRQTQLGPGFITNSPEPTLFTNNVQTTRHDRALTHGFRVEAS